MFIAPAHAYNNKLASFSASKAQPDKQDPTPAGQVYDLYDGAGLRYYLIPPGSKPRVNPRMKQDTIRQIRAASAWAMVSHDPDLQAIRSDLFKLVSTGKLPAALSKKSQQYERLPALIQQAEAEAKKYAAGTRAISGEEGRQWRVTDQLMTLLAEQVVRERYGIDIGQIARKGQVIRFKEGQDKPEVWFHQEVPDKIWTQDVIRYVPMGSGSLKAGSSRVVDRRQYGGTRLDEDQFQQDAAETSYYIPTQLVGHNEPQTNRKSPFVLSNAELERAKASADQYGASAYYDRSVLNPRDLSAYPPDDPTRLKDLKDA